MDTAEGGIISRLRWHDCNKSDCGLAGEHRHWCDPETKKCCPGFKGGVASADSIRAKQLVAQAAKEAGGQEVAGASGRPRKRGRQAEAISEVPPAEASASQPPDASSQDAGTGKGEHDPEAAHAQQDPLASGRSSSGGGESAPLPTAASEERAAGAAAAAAAVGAGAAGAAIFTPKGGEAEPPWNGRDWAGAAVSYQVEAAAILGYGVGWRLKGGVPVGNDASHFFCSVCGQAGELVCCDGDNCPRVFHTDCLPAGTNTGIDSWTCQICVNAANLLASEEAKVAAYTLLCMRGAESSGLS